MAVSTGATSWGTCRVYGTWRNYDGTNKEGTVDVRIPNEVRNATDDVIIPAGVFIKGMDLNTAASSISFDQGLPANDDTDNEPVDWGKVEITVKFKDGSDTEKYVIDTPVGGEVNLRTVINPTKVPSQQKMLVRGVPGGVAGLDGNGDVIDADGNVVGGGSGAVSSVNGKTGAVNLTAADVGARSDTWTPDLSAYAKTTDLNGYVQDSSNQLVPSGGSSGQILAKSSGGDYDTGWIDAPSGGASSWSEITGKPTFADVATSGSYNDLSDKPTIPDAPNLTPYAKTADLADVATSGAYGDLSGTPSLFSGSYDDLTNKPSIPSTAADIDAVPDTRTVNGKALSSDVTLDASDVSALPDSTPIPSTAADVDAVPQDVASGASAVRIIGYGSTLPSTAQEGDIFFKVS